jgi:hypothetical protein
MLRTSLLILGLLCFLNPSFALLMKGKVEVVKGRVNLYRNGRIIQVVDDMTVYTGDRFETSRHGTLMLHLMDIGLLKLKPHTQCLLPPDDDGQIQVSKVEVRFGEVWAKIRKLDLGEHFEIATPNAVSLVANAIAVVGFHQRQSKTNFSVIEGDIEVHRDKNHYFLTAGEKIILDGRKSSPARRRKVDIFTLNQQWKKVITIREKLDRKIRDAMRSGVADSKARDSESPQVHIVTPIEGIVLKKRRVSFKGTIYEDHLDRIILTVNEKVIVDVNSSLKNLNREIILKPGKNEIELKAIDKYGNMGVDRQVIMLSELPPALHIFFPFDNLELQSRVVDLQGVVDDPDIREVLVYLNDRLIARDRTIPTFHIPLILDVGENVLRVEAINDIGLTGKKEVTVYTRTLSNVAINFNNLFN